jgi:hypothetical protein
VVFDQPLLDGAQEEVVEPGIDEHDEEFGGTVPVFVDDYHAVIH